MITQAEGELESVKAEVADAKTTLQELGPLEALAGKVEGLKNEIADLENEVATLKANIDQLEGEKAATAQVLASAKDKLGNITAGRSQPAMSAKINRIDRRLGFVMLSKGIKGGVVGGSRVAVMRGGTKIGELSVTAVSANSATADIVHSTVKEGESVSVGDSVVPIEGVKVAEVAAPVLKSQE
jgi:outer membrane murein-binding lipoprotein Lpp